jgi:hypothetical protein
MVQPRREDLPAVEAELTYLAPMAATPRTYTYAPPAGEPRSNLVDDRRRVAIHDGRRVASRPGLDREGFALVAHRSAIQDFSDDEEVRRAYYPEAAEFLRAATGASRVFVYDHTVRRRVPGAEDRQNGLRQPATRVHVDQTVKSGPQRVRDFVPAEADTLLRGRVHVVNLWRPIRGPVRDMPLAVCDARSVAPEDLVAQDLVYPDRTGEIYSVTYRPAHAWAYFPDMRTDEALLLKCYHSAVDGRARFAPHTAFTDPTTPPDAPPRESIELRTLIFHEA